MIKTPPERAGFAYATHYATQLNSYQFSYIQR